MADEKKTTIKDAQDVKLFRCKSCTTEQSEAWLSWKEAEKEKIDENRSALFCPTCKNQIGIYSLLNEVDLTKVKDRF